MNDADDPSEQTAIAVLGEAMHELRRFGTVVLDNAVELSKTIGVDSEGKPLNLVLGLDKADILRGQATTILYTVQLMFARLNLIDIEIDPRQFEKTTRVTMGVYTKFDKARKMLREVAKHQRVRVKFDGHSHRQLPLYPVFDILPFLLLDNAVKYAPSNSEIVVEFLEINGYIQVTVNSLGPEVAPDELLKLTDKWFRGSNAKTFTKEGSGFGLYFSKFICDMHGIRFEISQKGNPFEFNAVPFRTFVVDLRIPT